MEDIIGKRFRRNKYGISEWSDIVTKIWVRWNINFRTGYKTAEFIVVGSRGVSYDLDEIIFE